MTVSCFLWDLAMIWYTKLKPDSQDLCSDSNVSKHMLMEWFENLHLSFFVVYFWTSQRFFHGIQNFLLTWFITSSYMLQHFAKQTTDIMKKHSECWSILCKYTWVKHNNSEVMLVLSSQWWTFKELPGEVFLIISPLLPSHKWEYWKNY